MKEITQGLFAWVFGIVLGFLMLMFFTNDTIDKGIKKVVGIILFVLFIVGSLLYGGD